MKSPLSSVLLLTASFIALLLFNCLALSAQGQDEKQLSVMIASKDLAAIRAAIEKDPALLTKADSRTKQTPLFVAIQSGQPEVVDLLLELGAPTNALNVQKRTPLHYALTRGQSNAIILSILAKTEDVNQRDGGQKATSLMYVIMSRNGDSTLIDAMIEKGADINLKNSRNQTALHLACYRNRIDAAKKLVSVGASLSEADDNLNTPLLAACMASPALTSEMLSRGADPLAINRQGQTALHLVCQASRSGSDWASELGLQTFQELLSKFDSVDLQDQQKLTPLAFAVLSQNSKNAKLLLERGADPNFESDGRRFGNGDRTLVSLAASMGDFASLEALIAGGAKVNVVNALGQTPLHSAVALVETRLRNRDGETNKRLIKTTKVLLAAKADPNAKNKKGQTPLEVAAIGDSFAAVELLVDRTDQLDFELPQGSLLHWAATNGLAKTGKRLLGKGADVGAVNSNGQTPLLLAAENGKSEMVELLIANQAKVDHVDNYGSTALLLAASTSQADVVRVLLQANADTAKLDSSGHSALHLAAWSGDPKVLTELLGRMKVEQAITRSGYTPLHAAAWNGHGPAIEVLLQGGADPNVADSDGWTPLHKAAYRGHVTAVEALLKHGADKSLKNGVEMTAIQLAKTNGKSKSIEPLLK